jgi:hypothetical protein
MLCGDEVLVVVVRKVPPQTVTRLARFAMLDRLGDDDVELAEIERVARAVERLGELGQQKFAGIRARAMQKQNRVVDRAICAAVGVAECRVV